MKQIFTIKDITNYRSELMGWAIVWIMMLHFTFTQIKPLGFIAQYGFAGVDIFILVSGLGLYFSLEKNNKIRQFYKKRLLRIFPTYYFLGIFASLLLFHDSILTYFFRYSTIGFWINGPYWEWYIPSIVALYFIAPFIKKAIDNRMFVLLIFLTIIILGSSFLIVSNELVCAKEPHFFLSYRIPAFFLGMVCAYWIKKQISEKYFFIISLIGIPFFTLLYPHHHDIYNYKYLSLVFLLPTFTICFIFISKYIKILNPFVATIGKASLEVYLIQSIFFHAISTGHLTINSIWHDVITITLIVTSSLLGIIVHWLIDKSRILHLL